MSIIKQMTHKRLTASLVFATLFTLSACSDNDNDSMDTPEPPPVPVQQGPDYGSLMVNIKTKLEAIIKMQRRLITNYVQKTNTNMTQSNKDDFRRTVAQIDGMIMETNPLIQMMENSAIPGNPASLGAIEDARRTVYRYREEAENNNRIIQEFSQRMNLTGSGMAGGPGGFPAAPGNSPGAPGNSPAPMPAQPWTDARITSLIDQYLSEKNLNQWGGPNSPNVTQSMPSTAYGKNRYEWLWQSNTVRTWVNARLK